MSFSKIFEKIMRSKQDKMRILTIIAIFVFLLLEHVFHPCEGRKGKDETDKIIPISTRDTLYIILYLYLSVLLVAVSRSSGNCRLPRLTCIELG